MSSVKDMIAKLNTKKTPPPGEESPPAVTVSNPVTVEQNKIVKRLSLSSDRGVESPVANESKLEEITPEKSSSAVLKRPSISQRIQSIKLAQNSENPNDATANASVESSSSLLSSNHTAEHEITASNTEGAQVTPPVKRQSVADKIAALKNNNDSPKCGVKDAEIVTPVKRGSIADKIAALQAKPVEAEVHQTPPKKEEAEVGTGTGSGPTKRNSIADKIAALKAKPEPEKTEHKPAEVAEHVTPSKRTSVADKIAALKAKPEPEKTENKADTVESGEPAKRANIADKIAALKAKPEPEKTDHKPSETVASGEQVTPSKRASIADKIAALKAKPEPEKQEEKPKPSAKASSIAEKIAAMQASNAEHSSPQHPPPPPPGRIHFQNNVVQHESPETETAPKPEGGGSLKRLSIDKVKFAAGINLAGLSPMAPRPIIIKPKPPVEEEDIDVGSESEKKAHVGGGENGEIQHLNLSRVSIRASVRRKGTGTSRPIDYDTEEIIISLPTATNDIAATGIAETNEEDTDSNENKEES